MWEGFVSEPFIALIRRSGFACDTRHPKIQIKAIYMRYRRTRIGGATYFFTVNTYNKKHILCIPENVKLLRQAFRDTMQRHPVEINAIVLLPDRSPTLHLDIA